MKLAIYGWMIYDTAKRVSNNQEVSRRLTEL
jgi:hypothetical protein